MGWVLGNGRLVYLDGTIDAQAGKRLETFIKENKISSTSTVVLNSSGGSLLGGIELGKVIRKHGLRTDVGKKEVKPEYDGTTPGRCLSACTLAYLGGRFRFLPEASTFGVHRFYWSDKGQGDADTAQMLSAVVTSYMKEMDVDVDLFRLSTLKGGDEMYEVPHATLAKLNVVNYGFEQPKWTIEGANDLVYLKGERETVYGINKFIIYCNGRSQPILHVIFDPQGREDEVMELSRHDLVVDGTNRRIAPGAREIKNGWYNGVYPLSPALVAAIASAATVGTILRSTEVSPIFLGFDRLPVAGGEQKIRSYMTACRSRRG